MRPFIFLVLRVGPHSHARTPSASRAARPRAPALVLAIGLAALPVLNDTCGLGCDLDRPVASSPRLAAGAGSCPLHAAMPAAPGLPDPIRRSSGPDRCGHDHASMRAAVVQPVATASHPPRSPFVAAHSSASAVETIQIVPTTGSPAPLLDSPALRSTVLRI